MTQFLAVTMGFWFYLVDWSVAAAAATAAAATATTTSGVTKVLGAREQNQWSAPSPNVFLGRTGLESKMQCSGITNGQTNEATEIAKVYSDKL